MTTRRRHRHSLASLHRTSTSRVHMTMASAGADASRLPRRAAAHRSPSGGAAIRAITTTRIWDAETWTRCATLHAPTPSIWRRTSAAPCAHHRLHRPLPTRTWPWRRQPGPDWPISPPSTQAGDLALASPVNRRAAHRRSSSAEPCRWLDARTRPRRAEIGEEGNAMARVGGYDGMPMELWLLRKSCDLYRCVESGISVLYLLYLARHSWISLIALCEL